MVRDRLSAVAAMMTKRMDSMKRALVWSFLILAIPSLVACSGGGDSTGDVVNNGGGSSTLSASFVPDMPTPTPGSVSL